MFKIINGQNGITQAYLAEMFSTNIGRSVYNFRTSRWNLALPAAVNNNYYRKNFAYTGAKVWNALQDELKCERSMEGFKDRLDSLNLSIEV